MDLSRYQHHVVTAQSPGHADASIPVSACRLAAAAGAVASAVSDGHDGTLAQQHHRSLLHNRLADLLGSAAALAAAAGLDLADVAASNLATLDDFYGPACPDLSALPVFDVGNPPHERFPRRIAVMFREHQNSRGRPVVTAAWSQAQPSKAGTPTVLAEPLGDPLTDNARRPDGYRYHDAIHFGFLAVLGWSPNLRALLRRKRKAAPIVDECEDGARAIFIEEGLAAILARLAEAHHGFRTFDTVTRQAVDLARAATAGLEVHALPGWLWRRAICHGFDAMHQLIAHSGGILAADLDTRTLTYQPAVQ